MRRTKIVAAMLSLVFVFMLFPSLRVNAATSGECGTDLSYNLDDDGNLTISGTGTEIKSCAFANNTNIKTVTISNSVTSIGERAFDSCQNLESISMPSVTSIKLAAFYDCESLENLSMPNVTSIEQQAFISCKGLKTVSMPSVTSIEIGAFQVCPNLTDVTMPKSSFETINITDAFPGSSATFHLCETGYCGDPTVNEGKNVTWYLDFDTGTLTISGSGDMADYLAGGTPWHSQRSNITSIEISDGVTSIGNWAFYLCRKATSVTISNTVTSIGDYAFYFCAKLNNVNIPASVDTIGSSAFESCSALSNITIEDTITSLGIYAFAGTALTDIPSGLITSTIPAGTFRGCKFTTITIPNTVTSIGINAFSGCRSLTSVTIPNSVTSIGNNVFNDCDDLQTTNNSISIDKALYDSNKDAFPDILLTSFNFTEYTITYATASNGTVTGTAATSVSGETIIPTVSPNSGYVVKEVTYTDVNNTPVPITPDASGNYAFTMPSCNTTVSATFILGGNCGKNGDNLKWTYDDATKTLTITGSGDMANFAYAGAAPWYSYKSDITSIEISDGVTSIGDYAFYSCKKLNNVTLPASVNTIGDSAFYSCYDLSMITIKGTITTLGVDAFSGTALTDIPSGLITSTIPNGTFSGCEFTTITIPNTVTSIGDEAFINCTNLTSVTMDKSLQTECDTNGVFLGCPSNLTITYYKYDITYTSDTNGTVTGADESASTDKITLTITPNANYVIDTVTYTDNGTEKTINKDSNGNYSFEMPVGATTVNATFKLADYEIKFVNTDGTVLQSGPVTYGNTPTYTGATPTKAADEQYTYTFSGWTPVIVPVTGDATYTAVFTETAKPTTTVATTPAVTTPAPGTYYVQSIEEKDGAIVITIKRTENDDQTYELVQSIETDGKQLSVGDQIELTSGSAIITIKKDFVSTLTPGTHTMKVTFKDGGSITLEYTVKAPETKAAAQAVQATGETTAATAIIGIVMILSACGMVLFAKKRREEA